MQIDLEPHEYRRENSKQQKPKSAYDGYDFVAGLIVAAVVIWFISSGHQASLNAWIKHLLFGT